MAPKKQVEKEAIVQAALEMARLGGLDAINARSLAGALGCSTKPIYLSFKGMDELKMAVLMAADEVYQGFIAAEIRKGEHIPYKASGMAYIRFAKEEKELFRLLFMRERTFQQMRDERKYLNKSIALTAESTGLNPEEAARFQMEMWYFGHGIATMIATSYLDPSWEEVGELLSDCYLGLMKRHREEPI